MTSSVRKRDLSKLREYIEANLRTSQNAGMQFIDPKNYKAKMLLPQNHVAFGRRGSGKSSLLSCLKNNDSHIYVYVNLEDYKNISFPNIILHVLKSLFTQVLRESRRIYPWYCRPYRLWKLYWCLQKRIGVLTKTIKRPDKQDIHVKNRSLVEGESVGEIGSSLSKSKGRLKSVSEQETIASHISDKLMDLQLDITDFKEIIGEITKAHDGRSIFLALDDLYFMPKIVQPHFVDFFHLLSKGSSLYLKIATIKHRSYLYIQEKSYVGTEKDHDIFEIDMDYTLDKFSELRTFMQSLLDHAADQIDIDIDLNSLFSRDGFSQLCLASGGVPRDFLSLFIKIVQSKIGQVSSDREKFETIGKIDVTAIATNNITSKLEAIGKDTEGEEEILEEYLREIKEFVYTQKRTNAFLVAKHDLENSKQGRQAIKELADMRLIHIIDNNTSCAPSDGRRYEAYIIDVGLYDNSRPRNFNQLELGSRDDKSRQDALRASPRLNLPAIEEKITKKGTKHLLDCVEAA